MSRAIHATADVHVLSRACAAAIGRAALTGVALTATAMTAHAQHGPWYDAYETTDGVFELRIELEQLPGGRVGDASVYMTITPDWCPGQALPGFCTDLTRSLRVDPGGYGAVTRGVAYSEDTARIAFALPGDPTIRIAEITRSVGGYDLRVTHPSRGNDLEIPVTRVPHSCNFAMCADDRLDHLRGDPPALAGPLALAGGDPPRTPSRGEPTSQAVDGSLNWLVIAAADGSQMGHLQLDFWGGVVSGNGMIDLPGLGPETEIVILPDGPQGEGFRLDIELYPSSGGKRDGVLLLGGSMAAGRLDGTLAAGDLILLIGLAQDHAVTGDFSLCCSYEEDFLDQDMGDLPGIGVHAPTYRLRNVPEGQRLAVRAAPLRSAPIVGDLGRAVTDILVLGCTPDIDSWTFEQADPAGRLRLLDAAWCEVLHDEAAGHIAGIYLDPILFPERH